MTTADIFPFSEHRRHLREHFDRVKETGRPLVITANGKPDAVVLSPDQYDSLIADAEYARNLRLVQQSIEEFQHGRGIPAEQVFAKVRKSLGMADTA